MGSPINDEHTRHRAFRSARSRCAEEAARLEGGVKDAPKGCRFNVLDSRPRAEVDANTPSSLPRASEATSYQLDAVEQTVGAAPAGPEGTAWSSGSAATVGP